MTDETQMVAAQRHARAPVSILGKALLWTAMLVMLVGAAVLLGGIHGRLSFVPSIQVALSLFGATFFFFAAHSWRLRGSLNAVTLTLFGCGIVLVLLPMAWNGDNSWVRSWQAIIAIDSAFVVVFAGLLVRVLVPRGSRTCVFLVVPAFLLVKSAAAILAYALVLGHPLPEITFQPNSVGSDAVSRIMASNFTATQLAAELVKELQSQADLESVFRYTFSDPIPTAESAVFRAFERLDLRRLGSSGSLPRWDEELPPAERERLIRELRDSKELFLATLKASEDYLAGLRVAMVLSTMLLGGPSYAIHLLCLTMFAFCLLQVWNLRHLPPGTAVRWFTQTGRMEKVRVARDTIPQLGFIGTLLGLSAAMGCLGSNDPPQRVLEQPGITPGLAESLGLSFNTTLIALVLSIGLSLAWSQMSSRRAVWRSLVESLRTENATQQSVSTRTRAGSQ